MPIFVLSRRPPPPSVANYPLVTYVTDGIASAMAQAKAAAKDREVLVHGANAVQQALEAGCWTKFRSIRSPCCSAPVAGCSTSCGRWTELEIVHVIDTPQATHIRYRIRR